MIPMPVLLKCGPWLLAGLLVAAVGAQTLRLRIAEGETETAVTQRDKAVGERQVAEATARGNADALSYVLMERSRGDKIAAEIVAAAQKRDREVADIKKVIADVATNVACPQPGVDAALEWLRGRAAPAGGTPAAAPGAAGNSPGSSALPGGD